MRVGYSLLIVVIAALAVSTPLWPAAPSVSKSTNPCADCHNDRQMYLDLLEGNAGNTLPAVIDDGQTLQVAVVLQVTGVETEENSVMSSITATLESQNGHFKVATPTYSVGSLRVGRTATAFWNISVLSAGNDTMQISAQGAVVHNGNQFTDTYSPAPAITVNKLPPDLAPSIALTAPAAGQTVTGGTALDVAWTASDEDLATCLVSLYYSTDNFASSNVTVATGISASQGYTWTTPRIDSATVRLKATVRDLRGHFNQSVQSGVFAIDSTAPSILSVLPADGANDVSLSAPLQVKFSEPVAESGAQAAFSISPDPGSVAWSWDAGGTTMTAIHAPFADGTAYTCTVAAGVKDLSSPGNADPGSHSWSFRTPEKTVPVPTIAVTSPGGGERLYQGDQTTVRWTASGGTGALLIDLSISPDGAGGQFSPVAAGIANTGLHVIAVPGIASDNCVIKATVYDQNGKQASATSGAFSVAKPLSLSADLPRAGARLRAGSAATLGWTASGGHGNVTVAISFQQEAGTPMQTIFPGLPTTGSRAWTAPQIDTATARFSVSAADDWGSAVQVASGLFSIFTNHAPRFTSSYVTVGELGVQYSYTATAADDDGDALVFSLLAGPAGMAVGMASGTVTWTPSTAGNFPIVLKVSDGMGGEALQEFTVAVAGKPASEKPSVSFLSPSEGQKVSGNFTLTGVVLKAGQEVTIVQVRVDNGEWMNASGNPGWQLTLDTTTLSNGNHTLELRAFDGTDYSDPVARTVNVDNTPPSRTVKRETSFTILDGLILLALFLAIVALFFIRRK